MENKLRPRKTINAALSSGALFRRVAEQKPSRPGLLFKRNCFQKRFNSSSPFAEKRPFRCPGLLRTARIMAEGF